MVKDEPPPVPPRVGLRPVMEGVIDGSLLYVPAAVSRTVPELTLTSHALAVPKEIPNVDLNQLFEEYMSHISIKNCRHSESVFKITANDI